MILIIKVQYYNVLYLYFRTYKKELIYMNKTSNGREDIVLTHLAVFENSIPLEDGDYEQEYVTSCVTLMSNTRVPEGKKHSVMRIWCHLANSVLINIFVAAWHVFQCK